ncbi:MAG: glycosyltransferase [Ferruginibacter sp.]|nr:glycosyltransferase [Ferruginibacter sp.]
MNNLPFYIAKGIKENGYNVTFLVDVNKFFLLDRPESWSNEFANNYPIWIKEWPLAIAGRAIKFAFPNWFFRKRIAYLNKFDIIVLNGHWISLGAYLREEKKIINIFAGYDLDVLANYKSLPTFVASFKKSGNILSKILPSSIATLLFKKLISHQQKGIKRAQLVNYFPTGIVPQADELLNQIKANQQYQRLELRGFDCNKFPYMAPLTKTKPFRILNITRFFFLNDRSSNKKNDIMIKGISQFIKQNQLTNSDVEITFFEKGEDVLAAKELCNQLELSSFIKWKSQVPVEGLINYFSNCDVAFDQLGKQWVGAGLFSMLIGRPLIANGRPEIIDKITKEKSPICQAQNEQEVANWLTLLYNNRDLVKQIGLTSREYVVKHYDLQNTINYFTNFFEKE